MRRLFAFAPQIDAPLLGIEEPLDQVAPRAGIGSDLAMGWLDSMKAMFRRPPRSGLLDGLAFPAHRVMLPSARQPAHAETGRR